MALELTAEDRAEVARICGRYPEEHKPSALLPTLHYLQERFGMLSPEVQLLAARELGVPPTQVREVVTFYEMFHEHEEGQFHLEVCTNIACHLQGGDAVLDHLRAKLGIECGQHTPDGMFSLMEAECLASCGSGPCMKVGEDYYEFLTIESTDGLLEQFKQKSASLKGKGYMRSGPEPHTGAVPGFTPPAPQSDEALTRATEPQPPPAVPRPEPEATPDPAPAPVPAASASPARPSLPVFNAGKKPEGGQG